MAIYAEEWQSAEFGRSGPPRLPVLEAGLELFLIGAAMTALALLIPLPLGWHGLTLAAVFYALVTVLIFAGLAWHAPHRHFGIANTITLCRAAFNAILLAVVGEEVLGRDILSDPAFRWGLTAAAAAALALDGVDGWVARRSGMTSEFGARFDMETDALFILALTLILTLSGLVGAWVLISGLIYYLFRLAGGIWPVLTAPLPPSWRRKTVCVAQAAFLIAALAPFMPVRGSQLSCLLGLALLLYSFTVDTAWLVRNRRRFA